jgi:hypothetical protein
MRTTKISIAIDKKKLRLARAAAKAAGMSLSAFLGRGVELQLEAHERFEAARELAATWSVESTPTAEERAAFRQAMSRARRHRSRAA